MGEKERGERGRSEEEERKMKKRKRRDGRRKERKGIFQELRSLYLVRPGRFTTS